MRHENDRPPGRDEEDAARLAESAAILRRVRQETDPQIGAHAGQAMTDLVGHFGARDADPDDRIEVIGTRFGRGLGLLGFLALAGLLAWQMMG
ncbi:hypothetical protein GCM10011390_27020 [Aureimonas endophytica]|uniref:Uncharacterized protein n=1 Tax=Aureimonas endophytica TaxID=2027858 RepID=A0A917E7E9_9HYPH|nr:hypothetical protein [Aureimonas endophytica]GGE06500.1 hypothetical protein GCM10011390_27020 [Aureimonas endophytica]